MGTRPPPARPIGPLTATLIAAQQQWFAQKTAGASVEERISNLEKTLRCAWQETAKPWHFTCPNCDDSGWIVRECVSRSCGRRRCCGGHSFVTPCTACSTGDARRDALLPRSEAAFTPKQKPRGFSRVGR
jgi:hypothetical protein